jgi:hypothetical protein
MARLVLRAGPDPFPTMRGRARVRPNRAGRVPAHLPRAKFSGLVDAKRTFILWPCKDIVVKTHLSPIVLPRSTEARGTPTSSMSKPTQNSHTSVAPPHTQDPQNHSSKRA